MREKQYVVLGEDWELMIEHYAVDSVEIRSRKKQIAIVWVLREDARNQSLVNQASLI